MKNRQRKHSIGTKIKRKEVGVLPDAKSVPTFWSKMETGTSEQSEEIINCTKTFCVNIIFFSCNVVSGECILRTVHTHFFLFKN